jgi:NSS family neurotransmitter:Na+ symporter
MGAGAYFPVAIKYVVPTVLTVMLCYQIGMEASGTYGGYPRWAIGIFGWLICVVTPLSLALLGCLKPLVLERKFCDGSMAAFEDVSEEIEMGPSALNLPD